jgi:hypothetical protein
MLIALCYILLNYKYLKNYKNELLADLGMTIFTRIGIPSHLISDPSLNHVPGYKNRNEMFKMRPFLLFPSQLNGSDKVRTKPMST